MISKHNIRSAHGGQAGYLNRMKNGMITGKVEMNSMFMDENQLDHSEYDTEKALEEQLRN